jgi:hypothetical protein
LAKQKVRDNPSKKKGVQIIQENKYAVFGLLGIFLLVVFFAASYKISGDDDLFWHLATGRYIVENKVVPDKDVFGHVTSGMEWIPFEWGWDVLTYTLYNIGGYNAILTFRSIAYCFIFFVLFMLLRKFRVNSFLSILMMFLLLIGIMDRLSPRPHIITYIFFVTLLYILLNFKYINREKYSKRLYLLPLIFLVWANSHMGVLAGGLVLFIFTINETIVYLKQGKFSGIDTKPLNKAELKKLWLISAICGLVLLVNPHGISTYIYAYGHTKMKMLETINEWRSPFTKDMDFGITLTIYKWFLYSGVLVLIYSYLRKDLLFALMFIGFAVYSVRAVRFTVDYDMIMFVFITISISYFISRIKSSSFHNFMNGFVPKGIAGAALIYLVTMIPNGDIYAKMQYYRIPGWGIDDQFMPVQLFDFIKENNIKGTPYNHFGTGGYLVWNFPDQKNYIDSRNLNDDIYYEYNWFMRMKPRFEKMMEERGIDYVIYLDPDMIRRIGDLKELITSYLSTSPGWKLVFWDDKSMLFLKNVPKFSEVIRKYEYKVIQPYNFLFNKPEFERSIKNNPAAAKEEILRKIQTEPNGVLFQNLNQSANKLLQGL